MDTILESIDLIQESEIDTMFDVIDSMNDYAQKACAIQEQYTDEAFESLDIFTESFYMEEAATKTEEPKKSKIGQFIEKIKEAIKKFFKKITEFFSKDKDKTEEVDEKKATAGFKEKLEEIKNSPKLKQVFESNLGKVLGGVVAVATVGVGTVITYKKVIKPKSEEAKANKSKVMNYEFKFYINENKLELSSKMPIFSKEAIDSFSNIKDEKIDFNTCNDLDACINKCKDKLKIGEKYISDLNNFSKDNNNESRLSFSIYKEFMTNIENGKIFKTLEKNFSKAFDLCGKKMEELAKKNNIDAKTLTAKNNELNTLSINSISNLKVLFMTYKAAYKDMNKLLKELAEERSDYKKIMKAENADNVKVRSKDLPNGDGSIKSFSVQEEQESLAQRVKDAFNKGKTGDSDENSGS